MAREKKPVHKVQMTEGKRNIIRQRNVFPCDTALLKALYRSTFEATKK